MRLARFSLNDSPRYAFVQKDETDGKDYLIELPHIPKTKQERIAEDTLRQELLVDWVELFTAGPAS
ncbi:MAG: hypothetical protein BHV61_07640 [Collinsella sp. 60_9]|nr:MAG: hypothetical protein BHV61_07640 [Collinsella sp. 60_9]